MQGLVCLNKKKLRIYSNKYVQGRKYKEFELLMEKLSKSHRFREE